MKTTARTKGFARMVGHERFAEGATLVEPLFGGSLYVSESSWVGDTLRTSLRWANMSGATSGKVLAFAMRGCLGRTITVDVRKWTSEAASLNVITWMVPRWSYDRVTWNAFDNESRTSGVQSWNDTAFTSDVVYYTLYPPFDLRRYLDWLQSVVFRHPLVRPTISAAAGSFTVATQGARTSLDRMVGRARPAMPAYGLRIGTGAKKVLLSAGIHSAGESGALAQMWGALDFILHSSESAAVTARTDFTWIIYPHLNPVGHACGTSRALAESQTIDPNRQWQLTTLATTYQQAMKDAIVADHAEHGPYAVGIDMHQHPAQSSGTQQGLLIFNPSLSACDTLASRIVALGGGSGGWGKNTQAGWDFSGTGERFYREDLEIPVTMTFETYNSRHTDDCFDDGANTVRAIVAGHLAEEL